MGNNQTTEQNVIEVDLTHPRFANSKLIKVADSVQLQTAIPAEEKDYQTWHQLITSPHSPPQHLFLPLSWSFDANNLCGSSGHAQVPFYLSSSTFHTSPTCSQRRSTTVLARKHALKKLICGICCSVSQQQRRRSGNMAWPGWVTSGQAMCFLMMRVGSKSAVMSPGPMNAQSGKKPLTENSCTWHLRTLNDFPGVKQTQNPTSVRSSPSVLPSSTPACSSTIPMPLPSTITSSQSLTTTSTIVDLTIG